MKVKRLLFAFVFLALIFTGQAGSARSLADSSGSFELVSVASDGTLGNGSSGSPSLSADGRYVAFDSGSSNLVDGDTNDQSDVFVHDRLTGITERISVSSAGEQGNSYSGGPVISADGRFVGFSSGASNLVSGDTNGWNDVFVHDRLTGTTERVSVATDGTQANNTTSASSISADGRFVAFGSWATTLVRRDTNNQWDVFVHDRKRGTTKLASVASDGTQGNKWSNGGSLSGDGRYIAFYSASKTLVGGDTNFGNDIFVHDRITGITERVSLTWDSKQEDGKSDHTQDPFITPDGRYVVFVSDYRNLVSVRTRDTWNIFLRDRLAATTELISVASDGTLANDLSRYPSISADGRFVTFTSGADNLVKGDTNGRWDVFLRDRLTGTTERITVSPSGEQIGGLYSKISSDGRYVAFLSYTSYVEGVDTGYVQNVYVYTRPGE